MLCSPSTTLTQSFYLSPPLLHHPNRFLKDWALSQTEKTSVIKTCPSFLHWPSPCTNQAPQREEPGLLRAHATQSQPKSESGRKPARAGLGWAVSFHLIPEQALAAWAGGTTHLGAVPEPCRESHRQAIAGRRHVQMGKHLKPQPWPQQWLFPS